MFFVLFLLTQVLDSRLARRHVFVQLWCRFTTLSHSQVYHKWCCLPFRCVCVCVCVCSCICLCVCVFTHMCVFMHMCMRVCVCVLCWYEVIWQSHRKKKKVIWPFTSISSSSKVPTLKLHLSWNALINCNFTPFEHKQWKVLHELRVIDGGPRHWQWGSRVL